MEDPGGRKDRVPRVPTGKAPKAALSGHRFFRPGLCLFLGKLAPPHRLCPPSALDPLQPACWMSGTPTLMLDDWEAQRSLPLIHSSLVSPVLESCSKSAATKPHLGALQRLWAACAMCSRTPHLLLGPTSHVPPDARAHGCILTSRCSVWLHLRAVRVLKVRDLCG